MYHDPYPTPRSGKQISSATMPYQSTGISVGPGTDAKHWIEIVVVIDTSLDNSRKNM